MDGCFSSLKPSIASLLRMLRILKCIAEISGDPVRSYTEALVQPIMMVEEIKAGYYNQIIHPTTVRKQAS
jgi:hypothetical protein